MTQNPLGSMRLDEKLIHVYASSLLEPDKGLGKLTDHLYRKYSISKDGHKFDIKFLLFEGHIMITADHAGMKRIQSTQLFDEKQAMEYIARHHVRWFSQWYANSHSSDLPKTGTGH